jgi:segregation and condensation protein B
MSRTAESAESPLETEAATQAELAAPAEAAIPAVAQPANGAETGLPGSAARASSESAPEAPVPGGPEGDPAAGSEAHSALNPAAQSAAAPAAESALEPGSESDRSAQTSGSDGEAAAAAPALQGEAFEAAVQSAAALLFASPEALSKSRLADLIGQVLSQPLGRVALESVLAELGQRLQRAGLPIALKEFGGGLRLYTEPRLAEVVTLLDNSKKSERISPAALETLAIVAYRQPVSKAEIEAIRGVQAGPMLRLLVDRGLLRISGRADQPGAPLLYGTTKEFLDRFGLARIEDLPRDAELARD